MKKHLIAAAVAASLAVPAMAQVTISGVLDTAVGGLDKGGTSADEGSFSGFVGNTFATSGFTISGSEDLGGGLKASFVLNRQFVVSTGRDNEQTAVYTDSTEKLSGGAGFDVATVGISGGFGSITLGVQDLVGREAFGLGRFAGNFGRTTGLSAAGDERDNSVNFTSASFNGFQIGLGYAFHTQSGDANAISASNTYGKTSSVGVRYENGPLRVAYAQQDGDYAATKAGATTAWTDAQDKSFAVDYNLGIARVGLIALSSDTNTTTAGKQSATSLNVMVPVGNGIAIHGAYIDMKDSADTSANKADLVQFAVTKDLSKRTTVYAAYTRLTNDTNVNFGARGVVTTSTVGDGDDPKAMAIGVRHSF